MSAIAHMTAFAYALLLANPLVWFVSFLGAVLHVSQRMLPHWTVLVMSFPTLSFHVHIQRRDSYHSIDTLFCY